MRRDRPSFSGLLLVLVLASPAVVWAQSSPVAQPSGSPAQPSSPAKPSSPAQPVAPPAQPVAPPAQPVAPPAQPSGSPVQPPAAPVEPKTADDYALEGRKLAMKPGMLQDARALLLTAWSMKKSYDIAGNLGSIEFELGMVRDAAEHLSFCQRNFPAVKDADQTQKLAQVESLLAEARAQVGGARIRVTDGDGVELQGAEVLVDDKLIGRAPLMDEVFLDPGSRVISAKQPGHRDASKQIEAAKGGSETVTIVLSVVPQVSNTKVTPPPQQQQPVSFKKRIVFIAAGAGLAVAGIGLGAGFNVASNGKSSDAQAASVELKKKNDRGACLLSENAAPCGRLTSAYDGKELFRGVAIGGYVAGGALALGTLAYVLLPSSMLPSALLQEEGAPASSGVRASVSVMPGGGGAVIEGAF